MNEIRYGQLLSWGTRCGKGIDLRWLMSISTSAVNILIGHLQNDVILLLRIESLRGLVSCANKGFCYGNLAGITKIE